MIEAAIVISIMGVVLFGALGIYLSKLQSCNRSSYSLDWFLTARNSQSWWSMAFAFLSASTGSWIFFLPSKYANDSDLGSAPIILMMYAIGASYPILMIGFIGGRMVKRYPTIRSLTDYAVQRFGNVAANYIACVCFISNAIVLVAEYTAIGKLFYFFNAPRAVPLFGIGCITLAYITIGGLSISLFLNKYRTIINLILIIILCVYVGTISDLKMMTNTSDQFNLTSLGFSKIIAMFVSYQSLFVFTEAMWQRVFAAESRHALQSGSLFGTILAVIIIFGIGAMGCVGYSTGIVHDPNVSFIGIFLDSPQWPRICLMILGAFISQGLISSLQHSLTGVAVSSYTSLGYKESLVSTRVISIFLHIPLMLIGLLELEITELYLIANILTITSVLPVLLGLVPQFENYITGSSVLLGCAFSLISVFLFGYVTTGGFANGIFRILFDDYSWEPFVIALISSLVGVGLCVLIEMSLFSCADGPTTTELNGKRDILPHHSYQYMDMSYVTR